MKKKFCFLSLIILFLVVGCNGSITRDIRHGGYSIAGNFKCSEFMPASDEDVYYTKIKYYTGSHIITEKGKLYEVSLEKKYTNGSNCRVVDKDITVQSIFDNRYIRSEDDRIYTLISDNNMIAYSEIGEAAQNYKLFKLLLGDKTNLKIVTANSSTGSYYVLKTDGNVYEYIVEKVDKGQNPDMKVSSSKIIYNKNDYDGTIIDFGYAGEGLNTYILTDSKLYRMRVKNLDECGKYADIACQYELQEDEKYTLYKDKIITFNGSTLITSYGKMFSVQS